MKRKYTKWIKAGAALLFAVLCLLITYNGTLKISFLPTWETLFDGLGAEDDTPAAGSLTVDMLDVGNADALVLQSDGKTLLIDAGENGDGGTVLAFLQEKGIERLDYVIATHADSDHIGGMRTVVEQMPIGRYIMAFMPQGSTPTTKTYLRLLQALDERNVPVADARDEKAFALGSATVELIGPAADFTDNNNQSVVCRVTCGKRRLLFMGDAEEKAEKALSENGVDLKADVLKVGHHGSHTGTSAAFLQQVKPSFALISCGTGNSYGHPHSDTLERLHDCGAKIYRTDLNGTVHLVCDGNTFTITCEKGASS